MSRMSELDLAVNDVDDVLGEMELTMGGVKRRPLEDLERDRRRMLELNAELGRALQRLGEALGPLAA